MLLTLIITLLVCVTTFIFLIAHYEDKLNNARRSLNSVKFDLRNVEEELSDERIINKNKQDCIEKLNNEIKNLQAGDPTHVITHKIEKVVVKPIDIYHYYEFDQGEYDKELVVNGVLDYLKDYLLEDSSNFIHIAKSYDRCFFKDVYRTHIRLLPFMEGPDYV